MPLIYAIMHKGKSPAYRDAVCASIQHAMIVQFDVTKGDYSQITI